MSYPWIEAHDCSTPIFAVLLLCTLALCQPARAYSLITHEQLIDLTWQKSIVPLLLSRYPDLTPAQLEHARAYAYGGCVIQDIGYYPLGDGFVSDLTHYVRSGDFVVNLFRDAGNADELAFAVGALSHYIGDSIGHSEATNLAVPVEFPKLRRKYGDVVNYAEGEHQHVQTEFAFDINQIAQHHLAPVHYLRHVGLDVPTKQLALAFYQTYGLNEDFTIGRERRINVGAYRFAVHRFIPRIAYATTLLHRQHASVNADTPELIQLQAEITAVAQANHWDEYRRKPGIGTYSLAALLFVLPKVGPLKLVAVKGPDPKTEAEYIHSVVQSTDQLNQTLHRFTPPPAVRPSSAAAAAAADTHSDSPPAGAMVPQIGATQGTSQLSSDSQHPLPNRDLDTGNPVRPSGYRLTDTTYATLAHRLAAHPQQSIPPGVRTDILAYYANLGLPFATRKNPQAWAALQADLATLRTMPTSNEPEPFTTFAEQDDNPAKSATVSISGKL
ncbi:MAG: zinc dependent phospholipase C family protein [Janthinobacterium lividum]